MPAPTDDTMAWIDFLGYAAASCDLYMAQEHNHGSRRDRDDLAQRADRYRDLQLAKLAEISKIRYEHVDATTSK